jgi:hypothetical protein
MKSAQTDRYHHNWRTNAETVRIEFVTYPYTLSAFNRPGTLLSINLAVRNVAQRITNRHESSTRQSNPHDPAWDADGGEEPAHAKSTFVQTTCARQRRELVHERHEIPNGRFANGQCSSPLNEGRTIEVPSEC